MGWVPVLRFSGPPTVHNHSYEYLRVTSFIKSVVFLVYLLLLFSKVFYLMKLIRKLILLFLVFLGNFHQFLFSCVVMFM